MEFYFSLSTRGRTIGFWHDEDRESILIKETDIPKQGYHFTLNKHFMDYARKCILTKTLRAYYEKGNVFFSDGQVKQETEELLLMIFMYMLRQENILHQKGYGYLLD